MDVIFGDGLVCEVPVQFILDPARGKGGTTASARTASVGKTRVGARCQTATWFSIEINARRLTESYDEASAHLSRAGVSSHAHVS
jgi:hypothetical protein